MFGRATKMTTGELPPRAADKFQSIADEARDARSVKMGTSADAQRALNEYQFVVREFENLKRRGNATPEEFAAASRDVELAKEPKDREAARHQRASEAAEMPTALLRNLEKWIASVASHVLKDESLPEPKLRKGESIPDAIERCRRVVRELRAEARNVKAAPIPSTESKAILRGYVDALGESAAPDLHYVIEAGHPRVDWPTDGIVQVSHEFGRGQFAHPAVLPAVALMAWAAPDTLYAALCRDVDAESDDTAALSAEDRFKKQATIAADRLANEREEEFWIERMRADGLAIARRPDADPRAVLGLASDLPPPPDSF
jgi:hypothetical protein